MSQDKSSDLMLLLINYLNALEYYYTDGYNGYIDIVYPGKHIRNIHDKSDTFTVEGVNADL
ncbi:MAG: hypothetical protein NC040_03705, partial [Muribaculaceae bacterium]|nr:hypothetical protein [Muribaculaceae bacterium]